MVDVKLEMDFGIALLKHFLANEVGYTKWDIKEAAQAHIDEKNDDFVYILEDALILSDGNELLDVVLKHINNELGSSEFSKFSDDLAKAVLKSF